MAVRLEWEGKPQQVERLSPPFQTVETINESRATRERDVGSLLRTEARELRRGGLAVIGHLDATRRCLPVANPGGRPTNWTTWDMRPWRIMDLALKCR